ncbi:hypothetical protein BMR04_00530 [Methylococcaceae bacterium HT3]|nr:hypothetical protein BMR04_00530 [Methylococcaceae bacterium HT3]
MSLISWLNNKFKVLFLQLIANNPNQDKIMLDFLIKYRGIFVVLFVLPASLLFKAYMGSRNRLVFWLNSAPEKHGDKVKKVQQQVKDWQQKTGGNIPMCTARSGWQAMSLKQGNYKKTHYQVDFSLMDILDIDEDKGTVRVEPMANMGQISAMLKPLGWSLAVVPELDALTRRWLDKWLWYRGQFS